MTDNTELSYQHVEALDDPAKPYKRIWYCPATNLYVKTHADRRESFGVVMWRITGSLCDASGAALIDASGALIHPSEHQLKLSSDWRVRPRYDSDGAPQAPSRAEIDTLIVEEFEAALRFVVTRVEDGELNRRCAAALGGPKGASS